MMVSMNKIIWNNSIIFLLVNSSLGGNIGPSRWEAWSETVGPLAPVAGTIGGRSWDQWFSTWSCWSWFQQLPAVFGLSCSCRSQKPRPMLPTAKAVGLTNWDRCSQQLELSVSASETNAPNSWSCRSQQVRPMLPTAKAVGLSKWDRCFQQLELSVSASETDSPRSWSCRSQ
jgi:hypothetical protein